MASLTTYHLPLTTYYSLSLERLYLLHHPFEMHAPGAFYEDKVSLPDQLLDGRPGLLREVEALDIPLVHPRLSGPFRDEFAPRPHGHEMIRRLRRDLADLLVGIHRVFAYLEHIAQNRHFALAGQGLQGLQRGTHGQGARVITIVDDVGVFHSGHQFHPSVSGLIGAERFGDLDQVQSENDADAGGRRGCVGMGFSEHAVDAHRHVAAPVFQLEGHSHRTLALRAVLQVRDAHVRALVETEGQHVRAGPA